MTQIVWPRSSRGSVFERAERNALGSDQKPARQMACIRHRPVNHHSFQINLGPDACESRSGSGHDAAAAPASRARSGRSGAKGLS